jgi:hypothetical protein
MSAAGQPIPVVPPFWFWNYGAGTEGSVMRNLSLAAFGVALMFLFASVLFIAASKYPSSVSSQLCSIGVSVCARPRLLLVPAVASLAWAWMLRLIARP